MRGGRPPRSTQDERTHLEVNPKRSSKKWWGSLLFCIRDNRFRTERTVLKDAASPDTFTLLCSSRIGFQNLCVLPEEPQSSTCWKGHRGEKGKPKSKSFTRQTCDTLDTHTINHNCATFNVYVLKAVGDPAWNKARILPQTHFGGQMQHCMQVRKQALTPTVGFGVSPSLLN